MNNIIDEYLQNLLQVHFHNLPALVSSIASTEGITNDDAIRYIEEKVKSYLNKDSPIFTHSVENDRNIKNLKSKADFILEMHNDSEAKHQQDIVNLNNDLREAKKIEDEMNKCTLNTANLKNKLQIKSNEKTQHENALMEIIKYVNLPDTDFNNVYNKIYQRLEEYKRQKNTIEQLTRYRNAKQLKIDNQTASILKTEHEGTDCSATIKELDSCKKKQEKLKDQLERLQIEYDTCKGSSRALESQLSRYLPDDTAHEYKQKINQSMENIQDLQGSLNLKKEQLVECENRTKELESKILISQTPDKQRSEIESLKSSLNRYNQISNALNYAIAAWKTNTWDENILVLLESIQSGFQDIPKDLTNSQTYESEPKTKGRGNDKQQEKEEAKSKQDAIPHDNSENDVEDRNMESTVTLAAVKRQHPESGSTTLNSGSNPPKTRKSKTKNKTKPQEKEEAKSKQDAIPHDNSENDVEARNMESTVTLAAVKRQHPKSGSTTLNSGSNPPKTRKSKTKKKTKPSNDVVIPTEQENNDSSDDDD